MNALAAAPSPAGDDLPATSFLDRAAGTKRNQRMLVVLGSSKAPKPTRGEPEHQQRPPDLGQPGHGHSQLPGHRRTEEAVEGEAPAREHPRRATDPVEQRRQPVLEP